MKGSIGVKLGIFTFIVVGLGLILRATGFDVRQLSPDRIREFILSFGVWAPVVYLAAYGQPVVPLPASVMTIAGGVAFGPAWGTLAALGGASLRACSEFLVARLLGREAVARLLKGNIANLNQKIGENGFKTVLLIRLIPNLPFDIQNYGLGFTQVKFSAYALASVIGMAPGAFVYVYLGSSLTNPSQIIWKLGLAVLLIAGLTFATAALKKRQAAAGGVR